MAANRERSVCELTHNREQRLAVGRAAARVNRIDSERFTTCMTQLLRESSRLPQFLVPKYMALFFFYQELAFLFTLHTCFCGVAVLCADGYRLECPVSVFKWRPTCYYQTQCHQTLSSCICSCIVQQKLHLKDFCMFPVSRRRAQDFNINGKMSQTSGESRPFPHHSPFGRPRFLCGGWESICFFGIIIFMAFWVKYFVARDETDIMPPVRWSW